MSAAPTISQDERERMMRTLDNLYQRAATLRDRIDLLENEWEIAQRQIATVERALGQ